MLFARSARRVIASPLLGAPGPSAIMAPLPPPGSGGNWSPPVGWGSGLTTPPFMGRATPKLGRAPAPIPPTPFLRPNALILVDPKPCCGHGHGWLVADAV